MIARRTAIAAIYGSRKPLFSDAADGLLPQESTRQFECYKPLGGFERGLGAFYSYHFFSEIALFCYFSSGKRRRGADSL